MYERGGSDDDARHTARRSDSLSLAAGALVLAACSQLQQRRWHLGQCASGEDNGSAASSAAAATGKNVTLSFLVDNSDPTVKRGEGAGSRTSTPRTRTSRSRSRPGRRAPTATTSSRPGSRPATWTTSSMYNSGSLFQALEPERRTSIPLTGEPFIETRRPAFLPVVLGATKVYGVPFGTRHRRRHPLQQDGLHKLGLRCPRPGPSSWPTTRRSRRPASPR